jgi:two-component system, cell cycle response regulator DivK
MATLLLAEDDANIRDLMSRRLQREGYEVITVVNGAEAIIRARSERPDLILMDMGLPLLNGYQAAAKLKATPETWAIPIIALTAFASASDRAKYLAAGCDEYESKPVAFERLLSKIQAFVGRPSGGK